MAGDTKHPTRVSVALCTYNGGPFVAAQLQSIVDQTRAVDEVVVSDDGSTDDTLAVVGTFGDRLPIRVLPPHGRLGVTKNFENAIRACTGDVIVPCDQDDVWRADKVAVVASQFRAHDSVAMVFSNARVVREDLLPAGYRLWDSIWFDRREQRLMREGRPLEVLSRHAVAAGSTAAFRARYLPLLLPFPDLPHAHDMWIALVLAAVGRVDAVDLDLIQYRLHETNHVGMRRYNLLGQIIMARRQIQTNAFADAAALHQAAYDRLAGQTRWPVEPGVLATLREKVDHARARQELPPGRLRRLGLVWREWRSGNYGRYSYGYKSLLQDLFLR